MKSVLVTGAYGFVGKFVARYFADQGYVVTGLGHGTWDSQEYSKFGLTFWHTSDVTLESLVTYAGEPDVIVHCAGSGSVGFSMAHPYQDYVRTVSSTAAVLEYVRLHSPRTAIVYPSSAAVYGLAQRLPIMEDAPLCPVSPYGMHKLLAEMLCRSYAASFNLPIAIVRFFSIYGAGLQKQLLWDACNKIAQGERVFFGTGAELRDWLHVTDAAALLFSVTSKASSACPIFNGGSGEGISVRDALATLFAAYGIQEGPKFNGEVRLGDPAGYQADMKNAMETLGWSPKVSLHAGMHDYVKWFKELNS